MARLFFAGRNPFGYLGFVVSDDGKKLTYYEHDGTAWKVYSDLPTQSVSFAREHWGKGFKLSSWVPNYDWVANNGYNNFASWVENAE
jgi:hypothetical protein